MKKRITAAVAALLFLLCIPVSAAEPTDGAAVSVAGESFTVIQENDRFSLSVDTDTTNFAVCDKESGKVWYAFPTDIENNEALAKTVKKSLQSIVSISYYNSDGNLVTVGNYAHSVEDGTFVIKKIKNGIEYLFSFARAGEKFLIPVQIVLSDDSVAATVPFDKIEEQGEQQICDLQLLPNFGCGYRTDEGYLFLPDGSGAIANFADAVNHDSSYSEQVYGKDMSQDLILSDTADRKKIRMPVYGIKNGDSAFLAILTDADSAASITASALSGYSTCGASFVYRESDLTGIQAKDTGRRIVTLTSDHPLKTSPVVRFRFLNGEKANYNGMAEVYRDYVVKKYHLSKVSADKTPALHLETFGGVQDTRTFFGFTVTGIKKAAPLASVLAMQKDFAQLGKNAVRWSLYGYLKGGYDADTVTGASFEGKLGSAKQLRQLCDAAGKDNVFLSIDLVKMFNHSFQSFKNGKLVKSMNGLMTQRYFSLLSNGKQKEGFGYWNYFNTSTIRKNTDKLLKNGFDSGILYTNMGDELYTDFREENPASRADLIATYQEAFKKSAGKKIAAAVESGNQYALSDTAFVSEAPCTASGFDLESYEIPFYAMALHGYAYLSTEPLNMDSVSNETFLKAMETGMAITYRLTDCSPYELKNTKLNFLYNSEYTDDRRDALLSQAKQIAAWQKQIADQCITSYTIDGNLTVSEYENGAAIVVNHGDAEGSYNNLKIGAKSFIIVKNI